MAKKIGVKGIESITRFLGGEYSHVPITLYKAKKKRKHAKELSPAEKATRRRMKAQIVFGKEYLAAHEKSSGKKDNGWLVDMNDNMSRALAKSQRVMNK